MIVPQPKQRAATEKSETGATYARQSIDAQTGIKHQHRLNVKRALEDGVRIPERSSHRFEDNDKSGANSDRPGFQRLVRIITSGQADFTVLYVMDRSRFGRWDDPRMHSFYEVLFSIHGVRVVYASEERRIDYESGITPEDYGWVIKDRFDEMVAAQERQNLIKRTRRGLREAVIDGSFPGNQAPYAAERWLQSASTGEWLERVQPGTGGRREGTYLKLRWVPELAEIVRQIYDLIEDGHSLRSVAATLNAAGILPPSGNAEAGWHSETVRTIARRPIYCGDLVYGFSTLDGEPVAASEADPEGERPILVRNFAPGAPVSRAQHERVQRALAGNRAAWTKRRRTSEDYLLSGLLVCAECGATWHGNPGNRRKDGSRPLHYRHSDAASAARIAADLFEDAATEPSECPHQDRYIPTESLDEAVLGLVGQLTAAANLPELVQEAVRDRIGAARSDGEGERRALETRLERMSRAADRATDSELLADTEKQRKSYRRKAGHYAREAERIEAILERRRAEEETLRKQSQSLHELANLDLDAVLTRADPKERKEILARLIHHIEVDLRTQQLLVAHRTAVK